MAQKSNASHSPVVQCTMAWVKWRVQLLIDLEIVNHDEFDGSKGRLKNLLENN